MPISDSKPKSTLIYRKDRNKRIWTFTLSIIGRRLYPFKLCSVRKIGCGRRNLTFPICSLWDCRADFAPFPRDEFEGVGEIRTRIELFTRQTLCFRLSYNAKLRDEIWRIKDEYIYTLKWLNCGERIWTFNLRFMRPMLLPFKLHRRFWGMKDEII